MKSFVLANLIKIKIKDADNIDKDKYTHKIKLQYETQDIASLQKQRQQQNKFSSQVKKFIPIVVSCLRCCFDYFLFGFCLML